jgi:DNA-binding beta-propeller fold protein YncE
MNTTRTLSVVLLATVGCSGGQGGSPAPDETQAPTGYQSRPAADYYVYVGAESADLLQRVRFGPDGALLDQSTQVGEMAVETEGPHGLGLAPDGRFIYMTTGHGVPDGKLWKYHAGPDTLVGDPILLGRFPATLDLTPDGLYAFVANFNLHGEHVPSTVSVVYTPEMMEVTQIETCVMPHGARLAPGGLFVYSACMMDDLLIEIDTRTFGVSRRFSVSPGREGAVGKGEGPAMGGGGPACSPTWAQPSPDGASVYVACNGGDTILEIDRESWTLSRSLDTGRGPYNLAVSPDGRLLIATLKQGGMVEFFDLVTGASLARVPSSTTVPHGVVVTPDSRYAFVSVEGVGSEPGKVDVFDLISLEPVGSVDVGQQAGGITFWKMAPAVAAKEPLDGPAL